MSDGGEPSDRVELPETLLKGAAPCGRAETLAMLARPATMKRAIDMMVE